MWCSCLDIGKLGPGAYILSIIFNTKKIHIYISSFLQFLIVNWIWSYTRWGSWYHFYLFFNTFSFWISNIFFVWFYKTVHLLLALSQISEPIVAHHSKFDRTRSRLYWLTVSKTLQISHYNIPVFDRQGQTSLLSSARSYMQSNVTLYGPHLVVLFLLLHIKVQFSSNHISDGLLSGSMKSVFRTNTAGSPSAVGERTAVSCDSQSNLKVAMPRPFSWPHAEPWLDAHSWKPGRF